MAEVELLVFELLTNIQEMNVVFHCLVKYLVFISNS